AAENGADLVVPGLRVVLVVEVAAVEYRGGAFVPDQGEDRLRVRAQALVADERDREVDRHIGLRAERRVEHDRGGQRQGSHHGSHRAPRRRHPAATPPRSWSCLYPPSRPRQRSPRAGSGGTVSTSFGKKSAM